MRFAGDGNAGFEAVLAPGERMALTRQALAAAHAWTIRLGAPSYEDLTCGLLDRKGVPVESLPCAELMHLDDGESAEARLGFYVELSSASTRESAELRSVAIASDAASDGDGDGVPTALDNCPNEPNPSQGACTGVIPGAGGGAGAGDAGGEAGVAGYVGAGGTSTDGGEGGVGATAPSPGGSAGSTEGGAPSDDAGGEAGADTARAGTSGTSGGSAGAANGGTGGAAAGQTGVAGAAGLVGNAGARHASSPPKDDSGCGCRVAGSSDATSPAWLLTALLGLGARARRRRRHDAPGLPLLWKP
jgi:MYXO-CTERM domain-containing protein